jgi:hypothetical protein
MTVSRARYLHPTLIIRAESAPFAMLSATSQGIQSP